jgi:hypothetical protein
MDTAAPVPDGLLDISKYPVNVALLRRAVNVNDTEKTDWNPLAMKLLPPNEKEPADPVTARKLTVGCAVMLFSARTMPENRKEWVFVAEKVQANTDVEAGWALFCTVRSMPFHDIAEEVAVACSRFIPAVKMVLLAIIPHEVLVNTTSA